MTKHESESRFREPYPTPKELQPRVGYSNAGLQARSEMAKEFASAGTKELLRLKGDRPVFSVVYRKDYSTALETLASKQPATASDLMRARAGSRPTLRIAEDIYPYPFPRPPFPRPPFPSPPDAAFWEGRLIERIKQILDRGVPPISVCAPDLDTAPASLRPGRVAQLRGTCFGVNAGRVLMNVAVGQTIDLIVSSWTETIVEAYLDPDLSGLRRYAGAIWNVTADGARSNSRGIEFRPALALYIAFDGICVSAGPAGYPVTSWPVNDPEDLIINSGVTLGDGDFEITNVNHSHQRDGHSSLVAPNAGGQSLAQGVHIGLGPYEDGCAEIMYTAKGPRGITPPAVGGLLWAFLGDTE